MGKTSKEGKGTKEIRVGKFNWKQKPKLQEVHQQDKRENESLKRKVKEEV